MRNEIKCFLSLVFVCVLLEICIDSDVYAAESITGEFSIKTQDEQKLTGGQKVTKGTKLVFDATANGKEEEFVEEPTYNFYYIVPGESKRNYIAKNVQSGYIWNTSNLEKFGELEIHMTMNIYTESGIQECLCDKVIYLNMVNMYEIIYLSNYDECNIYAMKFYCEDGKSIFIKEALFERDGYYFDGWNDTAEASGENYIEGMEYFPNDDLTLYAVWKEKKDNAASDTVKPQATKNVTASSKNETETTNGNTNKNTSSVNNQETGQDETHTNENTSTSTMPETTDTKESKVPVTTHIDSLDKPEENNELSTNEATLSSEAEATEETVGIPADSVGIGTKKDAEDEQNKAGVYITIVMIAFVVGTSGTYIYKRYKKKQN